MEKKRIFSSIFLSQFSSELSEYNRNLLKIKDFFINQLIEKLFLYYCRRSSNVKALHFPSQDLPLNQGLYYLWLIQLGAKFNKLHLFLYNLAGYFD